MLSTEPLLFKLVFISSIMNIKKISLLVVDCLRFDCVGYQNDKRYLEKDDILKYLKTPTIDSLSKESICFTHCYSTSSITTPVIASMFTGTTPINHNITNNNASKNLILNDNVKTLAEILKQLGYITVYAGDPPKALEGHNLQRGFDYNFTLDDKKLFEFLNKNKQENFFVYSHFEDVHGPYLFSRCPPYENYNDDYLSTMKSIFQKYDLPNPKDSNNYWHDLFKVDGSRKLWFPLYVKGVSKFDSGRLKYFINNLSNNGFLEPNNSLLILTSDHGEGKHTHNLDKFQHGSDAYDETSRVPLIIRLPSLEHKINTDLVSNIDVFKIILDTVTNNNTKKFIDYKLFCVNPFLEKRSFCWYMLTNSHFDQDPSRYCIHARTIITKNMKYVLRGKPEILFDKRVFQLNEKDFVFVLYFDLLGRRPGEKELNRCIEDLKTKKYTPKTLYEKFLNCWEYKRSNLCFVIDTQNDYYEDNIINAFKCSSIKSSYLKYFQHMIDIEHKTIKSSIVTPSVDEEYDPEVLEELKKLGYID